MKLPFFVARRYFFARKSRQLIQLISWVSLLSITVCTAALFIVLSVFNGLQGFVTDKFNGFHADLELSSREGRDFVLTSEQLAALRGIDGVEYMSEVCTDMAVIVCEDRQFIVNLKGVEADYARLKQIDTTVYSGQFLLQFGEYPLAVLGRGVEQVLQAPIADFVTNSLRVYYPKRGASLSAANPMQSLNSESLTPVGSFFSATDYDEISFVRRLTGRQNELTSLEFRLSPSASLRQVTAAVEALAGEGFVLKDAFQQESELYKAMRTEKWAIFAILSFILLIASFNMIGMMALLVLDKKQDLGIFRAMGADLPLIRKIFIAEGMLIGGIGAVSGLLIGFVCCYLQQTFHFIRFGEGYEVSYYPVAMHWSDVVGIFAVVICVLIPAVLWPVSRLSGQLFRERMRHE